MERPRLRSADRRRRRCSGRPRGSSNGVSRTGYALDPGPDRSRRSGPDDAAHLSSPTTRTTRPAPWRPRGLPRGAGALSPANAGLPVLVDEAVRQDTVLGRHGIPFRGDAVPRVPLDQQPDQGLRPRVAAVRLGTRLSGDHRERIRRARDIVDVTGRSPPRPPVPSLAFQNLDRLAARAFERSSRGELAPSSWFLRRPRRGRVRSLPVTLVFRASPARTTLTISSAGSSTVTRPPSRCSFALPAPRLIPCFLQEDRPRAYE